MFLHGPRGIRRERMASTTKSWDWVRLMEALAAADPEMMVWSNSGNWSEFLPKIAWSNPNLYLTDPGIATPWQGLNMTRLLDDARREQMVSLHYSRFVPYRHYTNCQYFFSQNSIVPDIRNFRYGALASLAVTPNLCLAEVRPWLDRLPAPQQDEVKSFYGYWTKFLRERTSRFGGRPGTLATIPLPAVSRSMGTRREATAMSSSSIQTTGAERLKCRWMRGWVSAGDGPCEIREVYPLDRLVLTSQGPTPAFGSTLAVHASPQQVSVLEVRPAPTSVGVPRIYGILGEVDKAEAGYILRTRGQQGTTHRFRRTHA